MNKFKIIYIFLLIQVFTTYELQCQNKSISFESVKCDINGDGQFEKLSLTPKGIEITNRFSRKMQVKKFITVSTVAKPKLYSWNYDDFSWVKKIAITSKTKLTNFLSSINEKNCTIKGDVISLIGDDGKVSLFFDGLDFRLVYYD